MENNKNNLLASLAVFRKLYDTENKDIYEVIAAFISDIIMNESLKNFSLIDIQNKLELIYEFNLPLNIIKTSIKRLSFISRKQGIYSIDSNSIVPYKNFITNQEKIVRDNQTIIENLIHYIEKEKNHSLNKTEKQIVLENFCNFLIDKNNGNKYLEYITSFLIKNEYDRVFNTQLNLIREGVILYTGIKFNNNISELGSWTNELTIFLETDILFDIAGYNGELYKNIIMDLLSLIAEINKKKRKKIITLKYFDKTRNEIDKFFSAAEHILKNNQEYDPTKTAMVDILNGCKNPSDIILKKTKFEELLIKYDIEEDKFNQYYESKNQKYNILSTQKIEIFEQKYEKNLSDCLECLNYVSILRGIDRTTKATDFGDIKYILLSENSLTSKIAWYDLRTDNDEIPLAVNIRFLTNKFWFKLNKGFGGNKLPKSLDIISKAQIVLSTILKENVLNDFKELQDKLKNGELSEKQVGISIVKLRKQIRTPEEILDTTVDEVISEITENQLNKFIEEQDLIKIQNSKLEEENRVLKNTIAELSKNNSYFQNEIEQIKTNEQYNILQENKKIEYLIKKVNKNKTIRKIFHLGIFVVLSGILTILLIYFSSDAITLFISIIISMVFPAGAIIYNIKSKTYSAWLEKKQGKYIKKQCNKIFLSEHKFYQYLENNN